MGHNPRNPVTFTEKEKKLGQSGRNLATNGTLQRKVRPKEYLGDSGERFKDLRFCSQTDG